MKTSQISDSRECFLDLYRELFTHVSFLETLLERVSQGREVDRPMLESHLAQMIAAISVSHKRHLTQKYRRRRKGEETDDRFHNQMVRMTRVVKDQLCTLLKASSLLERGRGRWEYLQTVSDVSCNIAGGLQHALRTSVLMPIVLN